MGSYKGPKRVKKKKKIHLNKNKHGRVKLPNLKTSYKAKVIKITVVLP